MKLLSLCVLPIFLGTLLFVGLPAASGTQQPQSPPSLAVIRPDSGSSSVWWVGASSTDSSALPNTGVKGTIQVISFSTSNVLDFWVADDLTNNVWGQVGYYIMGGGSPVAFYQIWNLNTNSILTTGTASVSAGSHTFAMFLQSGTTWAFSLDGSVFGTYDMGASSSGTGYPFYALSEEQGSGVFTFPSVTFSDLQVMRSGSWAGVATANSYGSAWGVQGEYQNSALSAGEIVVGTSVPTVSAGTPLWGSASPTTTSTTSTGSFSAATTTVTTTVTSTATTTVTATSTRTVTSTVTSPTTTTSTVTTTVTSPTTVTSTQTVTSPTTTTETATTTKTETSTVTSPTTVTSISTSTVTSPTTETTTLTTTSPTTTTVTETISSGSGTATTTVTVTSTSTYDTTSVSSSTATVMTTETVTRTVTSTATVTPTVTSTQTLYSTVAQPASTVTVTSWRNSTLTETVVVTQTAHGNAQAALKPNAQSTSTQGAQGGAIGSPGVGTQDEAVITLESVVAVLGLGVGIVLIVKKALPGTA